MDDYVVREWMGFGYPDGEIVHCIRIDETITITEEVFDMVQSRIPEETSTPKEVEQDAWPGDLIGIKEAGTPAGQLTYLIVVPKVAYEEKISDPWGWVDKVLADTDAETAESINEKIETLTAERERCAKRISDINIEIDRLYEVIAELTVSGEEPEWIKPIREILKPHEEELRKSLRYLGRHVVEVGLNGKGIMVRNLNLNDEVPDQTGLGNMG